MISNKFTKDEHPLFVIKIKNFKISLFVFLDLDSPADKRLVVS